MPVQAYLMTAIYPSGLLACQAWLIEFSSGVRPPDRQVFLSYTMRHACQASRSDECIAVIRHDLTGISYQLCLVGGYYVIYPLKFSLFTTIVFFNVFTDKPDRHA